MGRTLDEEVVLKEIGRWIGYLDEDMIERIKIGIKKLPDAQQWIPCSERLPEDGTEVFIYLFNNPKSPYIAWIEDSYWYTEEFEVDREHEPLAWMPLPDPWKGEQP